MTACDVALAEAAGDWITYYEEDDDVYGEGGTCWEETDDTAEACAAACLDALEQYIADAEELLEAGEIDAAPEACALPAAE